MTSDVCMHDSDSESLPGLFDLFPAPSNEISKGDIVWAKFKKLYWPALVRNVFKKEKKISVWYTDDPGKNFKLPMKNVFLFHDLEMTIKIKKDAREAGVSQAHEGLTSHALSYLNRKAQGIVDDPLKFFDQTFPFFTVEDWLKKNPNDDRESFMNLKIEPLYINHNCSTTTIRKTGSASGPGTTSDVDSEVKSTEGEEESNDESSSHCVKIPSIKTLVNSSDTCDNEYVDKIVTCITSGTADTHLVNIRSKKVSSEHQKFYFRAMESDKKDLNYVSYGPVEDIKKLREIIFYLLQLYDSVSCKKDKKRTKKAQSDVARFCVNKTEEARYVSSVWLPESIIYAISNINSVSLSEAKKLFYKRSVCTPENVKDLLEAVHKTVDDLKETLSKDKIVDIPSNISYEGHSDENVEGSSTKRCYIDLNYEKCKDSSSAKLSSSKRKRKKPCRWSPTKL